jgi:hypothetical protein
VTATATTTADAVAHAVRRLLAADGRAVVLVDAHDPVRSLLGSASADRLITVEGGARAAVGAGLVLGGKIAVSFLAAGDVVPPPLPGAHVLVVSDGVTAAALWAQGLPVVQPTWPEDVGPLLAAVMAGGEPTVMRVDGRRRPGPLEEVPPVALRTPRILREGSTLGLHASGAGVPVALAVARMLAGRGIDAAAVELPMLVGGRGVTPTHTDDALWLGPAPADSASLDTASLDTASLDTASFDSVALARMEPVPLGTDRAVLERVLAHLPARLLAD